MASSNAAKSAQLGMPVGTAQHKLRKMIMFKYIKLAGHDACFVCGLKIESEDDMSIEHKLPWQNRDTARFWDLDNIAFSHKKCNQPHFRPGSSVRFVPPEGMSWCSWCKKFKPIDLFNKSGSKWNGVQTFCLECNVAHKRDYRNERRLRGLPVV